MANSIERMIADTFMEMAQGLETGSFGKRPKVALTGMGSEHGEENSMAAADLGRSNEYNHEFWKKFRKAVKEANPHALILADKVERFPEKG